MTARMALKPAATLGPLGQVRLTIKTADNAAAGQGIFCDHISIGKNASGGGLALPGMSTFVEIKQVGGASGCPALVTPSQTYTSDWAQVSPTFTFTTSDDLIVVLDQDAAASYNAGFGSPSVGTDDGFWFNTTTMTVSWNVTGAVSMTAVGAGISPIVLLETR